MYLHTFFYTFMKKMHKYCALHREVLPGSNRDCKLSQYKLTNVFQHLTVIKMTVEVVYKSANLNVSEN